MSRKKHAYRTGGPSPEPTRHRAPYWCRWSEFITDKTGSREINKIQWFASAADAEQHGKRITSKRADVREFTDQERLQAIHIFNECRQRGLNVLDVMTAGLRHYGAETAKEITLTEAAELWAIWMTGELYSPKTIKGHELSLDWLLRQTDGERSVSTFTAEELVTLAKDRYENHSSRQTLIRDFKSFFGWAARNGYCSQEIARTTVLDIHKTKSSVMKSAMRRTNARPPRLTAAQIPKMFAAVDKRYHPALALAVFAGLRPDSELPLVEWGRIENGQFYGINFESRTIHIHKDWATKTRRERTLHDLPAPLWKILERDKPDEPTGRRVSQVNYTNWRKFVIQPIKEVLGMDELPKDIFRHTALSFQNVLAGQAVTMNNAGHSQPKVFFEHYNNAVGKTEAEEFNNLEV
jgi:integrase